MITTEEYIEALQGVKRPLIKAHDEITGVADFIEARLQTEKELPTAGYMARSATPSESWRNR